MSEPVRTADGDLVEPVALFAAEDPAQPLQGGDVPGRPIRTADGALVKRVAAYEVEGGVAVPVTQLGSDVGTDLTADPPLRMTNTGDGTGSLSIDTDVPGGVPTLDGAGKISASELPPTPLHETFEAADEAAMLAAPVSAPAVAIRTDFTPAHLFYLHTDPASTLGNWEDLGAGVSAGADPSAAVGTVAVNGIAATYMRSDGAPSIDQAMSPAWTGAHDFTGGTIAVPTPATDSQAASKGYVDSQVATASGAAAWGGITGTLANQTDLTTALGAKADQSALTAHTSNTSNPHTVTKTQVGLGNVDNTSDANKPISTATQAALDAKVSKAGDTMTGDLHMSEQKVVNIADGASARDAVNRQQLDTKADASDLTAHEGQQGVTGVHLPAGGVQGQVPIRGVGDAVAWADPPSAPVQSVNGDTGAVVLTASDVGAIPSADEGQAGGVATLDGSGKVPASQLNVSGGFNYLGSWDASTNTPTLADGAGNNGDMYKVSVAGSQDLGSGTVAYEVGDHIVYVAGTLNRWDRFVASEAVASVAGKTGVVTLVKADVGLDQVDNTPDNAKPISTATQTALDTKLNTSGGTMSGNIDLGTNKAINLGAPTGPADAVTKTYVDNHAAGGTAAWGGITGTLASQSDLQAALDTKLTTPAPLTSKLVFGTPLAANTPGTVAYEVTAAPDTLAMRTATGQVKTGTAADADDAAPKAYVDGTVANVNNALTTHVGTTGAGTHLPAGGTSGQVPVKGAGDTVAWQDAPPATAVWGSVTGDIANQGDLQQELNGRVLLTSKATETEAQAGTDDTKWMSALNVAQAIAEHQESVPETFTAHATLEAGTNDPTTGVEVLFGPTPGGGGFEAWQIDWVVYVSADPSGRAEFVIPPQTGITVVTSGIGPAVGGASGAAASVDSTALIFQADPATRLVRLTTFINSAPGSYSPIQLFMRSPDSVTVSAAVGSHVVAHKLLIAT